MALHNEILTGRHNRFIQKLFGMKGRVPSPQLSSEISVSQPIFHGAENRFLEFWNRYGVQALAAAAATFNSGVLLQNPAGSNVIAVIEKIIALPGGSSRVDVQYGQPGATGSLFGAARSIDGRQTSKSTVLVKTQNTVAGLQIGSTILSFQAPVNTSIEVLADTQHEIVLGPGDSINVQDNTVNELIFVSFLWRERFLEEPERQ